MPPKETTEDVGSWGLRFPQQAKFIRLRESPIWRGSLDSSDPQSWEGLCCLDGEYTWSVFHQPLITIVHLINRIYNSTSPRIIRQTHVFNAQFVSIAMKSHPVMFVGLSYPHQLVRLVATSSPTVNHWWKTTQLTKHGIKLHEQWSKAKMTIKYGLVWLVWLVMNGIPMSWMMVMW